MKKALVVLLCFVVIETAVALIAMSVSSDVAALAVGAIVGILFAGLLALVTALVRDERDMRQRRDAQRHAQPRRVEEQRGWVLEGEWRELGPSTPSTNAFGNTNTRMLPEPETERALVVKR